MRWWIAAASGVLLALAALPFAQRGAEGADPALVRAVAAPAAAPAKAAGPPPLAGVDLAHLAIGEDEVTAPAAGGRVAHLTIDPELQRAALRTLKSWKLPEGAIVALEPATGRVLAWASHTEKGPARDLCAEASAPAASVFKIATAAALVEHAGLGPDTRQCYSGGENRITAADLEEGKKDRWCATLAEAMGRSINTVFARLASKRLAPAELAGTAGALGFGEPLPFDVAIAPSQLRIPDDRLGFARTSAGFWNTTLSPLHGATLAATVANGGELVRPYVVEKVTEGARTIYDAPERQVVRRAIKSSTASALTTMMEATVSGGTSFRAFHDGAGRAFLPGIQVAGKTGTLSKPEEDRYFTWFVGFAPSRANPEIAIAALVVNGPVWRVKANTVARETLRAWFAEKNRQP